MAKVINREVGSSLYAAGVDRGVFYPSLGPGVPWNGLVSVKDLPTDTSELITYMDGEKIQTQLELGTYAAEIQAITYPPEFDRYDGYAEQHWDNQSAEPFNFVYRTLVGNDLEDTSYGYALHLVFNALAEPSDKQYTTLISETEVVPFTWTISTTPVFLPDARPSSHLIIESRKAYPAALAALEAILYGDVANAPRFPTMTEVLDLFESYAIFKVTDHGDGTATISGPDTVVFTTGPDTARFTWPSVVQLDEVTYRLTSL